MKVKRLLSVVTAFVMIVSLLPQISIPVMAAEAVTYNRDSFGREAIMNSELAESEYWFRNHVRTKDGYNNIHIFGIDYNMDRRVNGTYYITDWSPMAKKLTDSKQLVAKYGAGFRGDYHGSFANHGVKKKNSHQTMVFREMQELVGPSDDSQIDLYTDNWDKVPYHQYFYCRFTTGGCSSCGTPKISNPVLAYADMTAPTITDWYATGNYSAHGAYSRDEVSIAVEFSEPIRFADDSANHGDVYLELILINRNTNASYSGEKAYLHSLDGDKLIFKYKIPETLPNGQIPNHYIAGIKGMYDSTGSCFNRSDDNAYTKKLFAGTSEISGNMLEDAKKFGFHLSGSLVTDLVGNEVTNTKVLTSTEGGNVIMDLVSPYIEKIDLSVEDGNGTVLNSSSATEETVNLFAKPGYKYKFTVQTSEVLGSRDMKITLNLKDSMDRNIVLNPTGSGTLNSLNNPPTKQLLYYELTLTEDMIPDATNSVQVIDVSTPSDPFGNVLDKTEISAIAQDSFPDLLGPIATTDKTNDGNGYVVERIDDNTVSFDFNIVDDDSHGQSNVSGIIPIGDMADLVGSVTVKPVDESVSYSSVPFEYALVREGEEATYQSGLLGNEIYFPQSPGGKRILYIRIGEDIPANVLPFKVSVTGGDIAGNKKTTGFVLDDTVFIDIIDTTGPVISFSGNATSYDGASGEGKISVDISITDINSVSASSVEYAWTEVGVEPTESDWAKALSTADGETLSATVEKNFAVTTDTEIQSYDLYVRANDLSTKNNDSVYGPKTYSYNRLYPSYSITAQETGMPERAGLKMDWEAYTPPADGVELKAIVFMRPTRWQYSNDFIVEDRYIAYNVFFDSAGGTDKDLIGEWFYEYFGVVSLDVDTGDFTIINGGGGRDFIEKLDAGTYYGSVDTVVQVGYASGYAGDASGYPVSQSSFLLRTAGDWEGDKFTVNVEWDNPDKFAVSADWDPNKTAEAASLSTLAGQAFTVTIDPIVAPEYGVSDIDFENSYAELVYSTMLYEGGEGYSPGEYGEETSVAKFPLTGGTTRIVIPEGLPYYEAPAYYKLKTHIQTISAEGNDGIDGVHKLDKENFFDQYILVDARPIHPFGLAKIEENLSYTSYPYNEVGSFINNTAWYGYAANRDDGNTEVAYTQPDQLILGTYADGENFTSRSYELYFTTTKQSNDQYIQLRNITAGWTGMWRNLYDQFATVGRYDVIVYDTAEQAAACGNQGFELPVVANVENIIEFQVRNKTGYSQKHTIVITPDNTMEPVSIVTDPAESDVPVTEVRAVIEQMPVGSTVYYARNLIGGLNYEWKQLDATEIQMIRNEKLHFIIKDLQGNITSAEISAPDFLWADFPESDDPNTTPGGTEYTGESIRPTLTDQGRSQESSNVVYVNMQANQVKYTNNTSLLLENGFKLNLTVNEEYGNRIGGSSITYEVPPMSEWNGEGIYGGHRFTPNADERWMGMFTFDVSSFGDTIEIYGLRFLHRYDDTLAEGAIEHVTLSFTVEDDFGYVSDPLVYEFDMKNIEPKLLGVNFQEYQKPLSYSSRELWLPVLAATVPIAEVYPNSVVPEENNSDTYRTSEDYYTDESGETMNCWIKPFVSVYRDGVYDIGFVDVFGDYYRQTVIQPVVRYTAGGETFDTGMDISFSDPDPETGMVTMTYKSMDSRWPVDIAQGQLPDYNDGNTFRVETSSDIHEVLAACVTEATVEVDPAKPVLILRYDPYRYTYERTFAYMNVFSAGATPLVISNFVNNPPVATVQWYFEEFKSNTLPVDENGNLPTTTSENVTAYLVTDTSVNPINAKGMYHTFTYGEDDSFTFEFEDYHGEQGSLTVSLSDIPITLTEPVYDEGDTLAPEYTLEIYGMYNSTYESQNAYQSGDSGTVSDAIHAIDYVQGYLLSFQISDDSPAKLVVKEAGTGSSVTSYKDAQSDSISGVKATGTQVAINSATGFDIVIIDASDNKTVITVDDSAFRFDLEPPFVEDVQKEQSNFYEVTAYIKLKDNVSSEDEIRWIYPLEARKVTSGEYAGRYAIIFDGNGSINIRYADALGNQGTSNILVDELDESTPAVTKVTWSPGNISTDGKMDSSTPPQQMTNTDVVAVIEFSTQIQEINISRKDGLALSDYYISALLQEDQAIITFKDSLIEWNETEERDEILPWDLDIAFTGVNGITGNYNLQLGAIIDKNSPSVWPVYSNPDHSPAASSVPYVEVTFKGMEDFYLVGGGSKLYKADEGVTRQITENGRHVFKFADAAGNIRNYDLEITNIDNDAPVLLLGDLPELDYSTNSSVTFKATLNEAGTVTVNGETKTVSAPIDGNGNGKFDENECNWVTFSVSENGGYKISAKDNAGLITEQYLTVNCIDRTAPRIEFSPSTFNMIAGSEAEYVKEVLMTGITTYDTVSKAEDIVVTMDAFDESILTTAGVHTITYSATDKAGNKATGKRYLRIYPASEPQILLNGIKTFSKEVTLLKDNTITLSVSNLPGGDGEPYTVYLRQGRWSEGQMKRNYDVIDTAEFTVDKNKYYTLYIVTQSRGTYLTNFYVQ